MVYMCSNESAIDRSIKDTTQENSVNHETVTRTKRARELYKYFRPSSLEHEQPAPSLDESLLSSLAQLVALRLRCRCLINLIDHSHQYRVAEATLPSALGEVDLPNANEREALWEQCRLDLLENSVCSYTINVSGTVHGTPAFFEVLDLSQDSRFSDSDFVSGPPYFRYYFGLPLRTKTGVTIGALAVVDSQPRSPMPRQQCSFLETIRENIMTYLETELASHERLRSREMNASLNEFVDPGRSQPDQLFSPPNNPSLNSLDPMHASSHQKAFTTNSDPHLLDLVKSAGLGESSISNSEPSSTSYSLKATNNNVTDPQSSLPMKSLDESAQVQLDEPFKRAAKLLSQSLMLNEDGGIVFLDTANANTTTSVAADDSTLREINYSPARCPSYDRYAHNYKSRIRKISHNECRVIASSRTLDIQNVGRGSYSAESGFSSDIGPMSVEGLSKLIKDNPQGKMWTSDGNPDYNSSRRLHPRQEALRTENFRLAQAFPGAFSVFMFPIWDARSGRWTALFAYSSSYLRTFSQEIDVPHVISFANCISLELLRLATAAADRQKGDFIGSISHELRSPLHGVLASCELLRDTGLSEFQQSFVETANSCGRTLLDTINMILDYSKINSLEPQRMISRKVSGISLPSDSDGSMPNVLASTMNPYSLASPTNVVDLAAIVEEVVEGAAISQAFQDLQHIDNSDVDSSFRGGKKRKNFNNQAHSFKSRRPVEIFLEISDAPQSSWSYITQPGAFRRVVMNLVGNAMKYTHNGWIKIGLKAQRLFEPTGIGHSKMSGSKDVYFDTISLTVVDTGKGMSSDFLNTKVFMPFAQEDTLAPGIGLGLSMVKKLLYTLDGDIGIESTLNRGTSVTVTIPMRQPVDVHDNPQSSSQLTPSFPSITPSTIGKSDIDHLRKTASRCQVSFVCQPAAHPIPKLEDDLVHLTQLCLEEYVRRWFGLSMSTSTSFDGTADIIVTDDSNLKCLLSEIHDSDHDKRPGLRIVVLCSDYSRHATPFNHGRSSIPMEFVSKPFGPYKLARAFRAILDNCNYPNGYKTTIDASRASNALQELTGSATVASEADSQREKSLNQSERILANEDSPNVKKGLGVSQALEPTYFSASLSEEAFPPSVEFPLPKLSPSVNQNMEQPTKFSGPYEHHNGLLQQTNKHDFQFKETERANTLMNGEPGKVRYNEQQRNPKILLVDDNLINLKILEAFMKKLKFSMFTSACNGAEACEAFDAALISGEPYDIIFLDLSMPVLDGFEAARRIRASEINNMNSMSPIISSPAPVMIVALTGLANENDQLRAFDAGMDLYMTKPASFKEVKRLIHNWIASDGASSSDLLPGGPVSTMPVDFIPHVEARV